MNNLPDPATYERMYRQILVKSGGGYPVPDPYPTGSVFDFFEIIGREFSISGKYFRVAKATLVEVTEGETGAAPRPTIEILPSGGVGDSVSIGGVTYRRVDPPQA